ncbi:MAG: hypothetical protein ISR83_08430 [Candidatus Marinimicrobia bacterium]|nr:hypothetical protein [Candidatus Neomarinimicrobiota bacterium]
MILALLKRRLWLWQNQFIPLLILFLIFPIAVFSLFDLSMRNIIIQSLGKIPYDQWAFPGIITIIGSMIIFPPIYRDYYHLRVHGKVLKTVALAPFSKRVMVHSFLSVAVLEAMIVTIGTSILFVNLISTGFTFGKMFGLYFFLILFYGLIGNIFITMALWIESATIYLLATFLTYCFIIFGSGLLFELDYFPVSLEFMLSLLPLSLLSKAMHLALFSNSIEWILIVPIIIIIALWTIGNGMLLRKKLIQ